MEENMRLTIIKDNFPQLNQKIKLNIMQYIYKLEYHIVKKERTIDDFIKNVKQQNIILKNKSKSEND